MRGPGGKGHAEMAITQQRGGEERSSAEEMENDWQGITLDDSLDVFSQVEQHYFSFNCFETQPVRRTQQTEALKRVYSLISSYYHSGKGYVALETHGHVALILRMNGSDRM